LANSRARAEPMPSGEQPVMRTDFFVLGLRKGRRGREVRGSHGVVPVL
jgi:hypothetical protein